MSRRISDADQQIGATKTRTFFDRNSQSYVGRESPWKHTKLFVHQNGFGLIPVDAKPLTFCRMSPRGRSSAPKMACL